MRECMVFSFCFEFWAWTLCPDCSRSDMIYRYLSQRNPLSNGARYLRIWRGPRGRMSRCRAVRVRRSPVRVRPDRSAMRALGLATSDQPKTDLNSARDSGKVPSRTSLRYDSDESKEKMSVNA